MSSWKVPFRSIKNVSYEVRIWDGSSYDANNAVTLIGAEEPFTTQEDNDSDIFTPIRIQTGYIRIVAESTDLLNDLMPTDAMDKKVILYDVTNSAIRWAGYIQPQDFSQSWESAPYEIELPVMNSFEVMKTQNVFWKGLSGLTYNIAKMIYYAFNVCRPVVAGTVYFPDNVTDSTSNAGGIRDLIALIPQDNFWKEKDVTEELLPGESEYESNTYYEVLEAICNFYGWTVREYGNNIYFTSKYDDDVENVRSTAFTSLLTLGDTGTISKNSEPNPLVIGGSDVPINGSDHSVEYIHGYKSVKVESEPNSQEEIFTTDLSKYKGLSATDELDYRHGAGINVTHYRTVVWSNFGNISGLISGHSIFGNNYSDAAPESGTNFESSFGHGVISYRKMQTILTTVETGLVVNCLGDGNYTTFNISSKNKIYCGSNSMFKITGNVGFRKQHDLEDNTPEGNVECKVAISLGDLYYYPGSAFSPVPARWDYGYNSVTISLNGGQIGGKSSHQTIFDSIFGEGAFFSAPSSINSSYLNIEFRFNNSTAFTGIGAWILNNLTVELVEKVPNIEISSIFEDVKNPLIRKSSGSNFNEEYSKSFMIASPSYRINGYGVLRQRGTGFTDHHADTDIFNSQEPFANGSALEKRMADYYAGWYNRTHEVLTVEVENKNTYTPVQTFKKDASDRFAYASIGIETNWRDESTKLTLIDL